MTARPCSCDDSKSWQLRALAAEAKNRALELALKFARQQLNRLLDRLDIVVREQFDLDPSEERIPGTMGETVFASGVTALSEVHGLDGVVAFAGGTAEERLAAVDAAAKGNG